MSPLAARADRLRRLHRPGEPVVLPNAWDPVAAARFAASGAPAVATSSAAVARAMGSEDEQRLSGAAMLAAVGRIAAALPDDVPLTADLEAGYGLAPDALVDGLLRAGAVGCNLEDTDHARGGLRDVDEQASWLAAVKAAGRDAGVDVVLNARVDVHLHGGELEEGLARARAYREAGADCVYPILVRGDDAVRAYVAACDGLVNVLWEPGSWSLDELRALGVARVSFGAGLAAVAYGAAASAWQALVDG
jgi:2-methylisocitrate lyase-like PEP mutase family enzyme